MEIIRPTIILPMGERSPRYFVPLPVEMSYRAVASNEPPDGFLKVVAVYEYDRHLGREGVQYRFVGVNVMHLPTSRAADGGGLCEHPDDYPADVVFQCRVCGKIRPRR